MTKNLMILINKTTIFSQNSTIAGNLLQKCFRRFDRTLSGPLQENLVDYKQEKTRIRRTQV